MPNDVLETTQGLFETLVNEYRQLTTELSTLLTAIQGKCTDQQVQQIQVSLIGNINHNAALIANRQLVILESVSFQLNQIANTTQDLKTRAQLQELCASLDKSCAVLKRQ